MAPGVRLPHRSARSSSSRCSRAFWPCVLITAVLIVNAYWSSPGPPRQLRPASAAPLQPAAPLQSQPPEPPSTEDETSPLLRVVQPVPGSGSYTSEEDVIATAALLNGTALSPTNATTNATCATPALCDAAPSVGHRARCERDCRTCGLLRGLYSVEPGVRWGTLPKPRQDKWRILRCDEFFSNRTTNRTWMRPRPLNGTRPARAGANLTAGGAAATATKAVPIFWSGLGGVAVYRIPALVRVAGELLAFAEARPTIHDSGRIRLVFRRSADGGRTWGEVEEAVDSASLADSPYSSPTLPPPPASSTVGNPAPLWLRKGNVLLLLFCSNGASIDEEGVRAARGELGAADGRRVWISRSYDRGRRWEPPREITADVKREGWTWYATGPGGAVELEDGTIAVPATHAVAGEVGAGAPGYGVTDRSHLLLSDDQGKSWRLGAEGLLGSNEAAVAQLSDGRLLLNARDLTAARQRALHYSADGGATFSHADRHPSLPEPPPRGCHAAMVAAGPALFLTALDSSRARERLTLRRSDDGGSSWDDVLVLWAGPSAYSSMRVLPGARGANASTAKAAGAVTVGVLSERGAAGGFFAERIDFQRVTVY